MFSTPREFLAFMRKEEVEAVDLKVCDLVGRWHHVSLPACRVDEGLLEDGVGFDGSNFKGFKRVEAGDMVLMPDVSTAFVDPFFEDLTLSVICSVLEAGTLAPYPRDPRGVARRAEAALRMSGLADEARFGPELEFYLVDRVTYKNDAFGARYEMISGEADANGDGDGYWGGRRIQPKGGYHACPPEDRYFNVRAEMVRMLEAAGVEVRYHHHEVGAPGQQEIEVTMQPLTRAGDVVMMAKYFVRMVAERNGLVATFMPKPFCGEAGTGMHFHQHLFLEGRPLFYAEHAYGRLSPLALSYVAGILSHAGALLALTNPSTNSFRRLVPGYEAPVNAFFSLANRSAAIRIPEYAVRPEEVRIEFRPPDPTCNPYLAMAGMLLAGLDGMKRRLDPTAMGFGPYDENVFEWSEEDRRRRIRPLPDSFEAALQALEEDTAFLLADGVFDEALLRDWCRIGRDQCMALRLRPHPYEVELLLGC